MGARLEPLLHPKPGAVTRVASHDDKGVLDFVEATYYIDLALVEACETGSIARGLKAFLEAPGRPRVNVSLGTLLLLTPLAAAAPHAADSDEAALRASLLARSSGPEVTEAYYRLLEEYRPSHLRRYRGPVPPVGHPGPLPPFGEVLEAASWDLVHGEILKGYPEARRVRDKLARTRGAWELEALALEALLGILARRGDTLILAKWGARAYLKALHDARTALALARRLGVFEALAWLDSLWRPRRWNPGASLDVLAAGISLYYLDKTLKSL